MRFALARLCPSRRERKSSAATPGVYSGRSFKRRRSASRGQVAEKKFGMLRVPQHERKIINDFKSTPIVLSHVEGLRERFSADREFRMSGYIKYCLILLVLF